LKGVSSNKVGRTKRGKGLLWKNRGWRKEAKKTTFGITNREKEKVDTGG